MQNIVTATVGNVSIDLRAALRDRMHREITLLFKDYLAILQQLADEHDEALDLLYAKLPAEYRDYVDLADHFTDDKGQRIRKMVLDKGNDCIRALAAEIEKYEIEFRNQKD